MSDEISLFELFIDLSGEFQSHVIERSYVVDNYILSEYVRRMIEVENLPTPVQILDLSLVFDPIGTVLDFIRRDFYVSATYPLTDYCNGFVNLNNKPEVTNYIHLELDVVESEIRMLSDQISIEFREQTLNLNSFNANT